MPIGESVFEHEKPIAKTAIVDSTPLLTPEQFEAFTTNTDAIVLLTYATGTTPERLNGVIKAKVDSGIPLFLLSKNPGDEAGIVRVVYDTLAKAIEAGAIPLEKVNSNDGAVVLATIQNFYDQGLRGEALGVAVQQRFAYQEGEEKPKAEWEI